MAWCAAAAAGGLQGAGCGIGKSSKVVQHLAPQLAMPDQLPPSTSPSPLAGQAMDEKVEREIVQHLQDDDMVVRVIDPKSEEMGDGVYR